MQSRSRISRRGYSRGASCISSFGPSCIGRHCSGRFLAIKRLVAFRLVVDTIVRLFVGSCGVVASRSLCMEHAGAGCISRAVVGRFAAWGASGNSPESRWRISVRAEIVRRFGGDVGSDFSGRFHEHAGAASDFSNRKRRRARRRCLSNSSGADCSSRWKYFGRGRCGAGCISPWKY